MYNADFRTELQNLINRYNIEGMSNTPDFILMNYLMDCLRAFDFAVNERTKWYER